MEYRILNSSNPESHERLEMESKFRRQGIRIQTIRDCLGRIALGRNVDPIYNKAKSLLSCSCRFSFFYSFLFIDPLPLFTDMVLILFGKVISEISKKKEKCSTRDGPGTIVALEQQHI